MHKYDLWESLEAKDKRMLIAFLYVDNELHSSVTMEKAMTKAIRILREKEA